MEGRRIDQLPAGIALAGTEVLVGALEGAARTWTSLQFATYVRDLLSEAPQRILNADGPILLSDAGGHVYHASADTAPRTWTIPSNDSVAFGIGDAVTFINAPGAGTIIITIDSDTLWLGGTLVTGSRTLASGGIATAVKTEANLWAISGAGLT